MEEQKYSFAKLRLSDVYNFRTKKKQKTIFIFLNYHDKW